MLELQVYISWVSVLKYLISSIDLFVLRYVNLIIIMMLLFIIV